MKSRKKTAAEGDKIERVNHKPGVILLLQDLLKSSQDETNKMAIKTAIHAFENHISAFYVEMECAEAEMLMEVSFFQNEPSPQEKNLVYDAAIGEEFILGAIKNFLYPFISKGSKSNKTQKFKISVNKQIKVSGHWIDQQLKYNLPSVKTTATTQLSIFDQLLPATKNKIVNDGVDIEFINRRGESTPLERGHYKLLDCLCTLLNKKSKNVYNKELPDYFGGEQMVSTGSGNAPSFTSTLYEIAKIWNGDEIPSGKTMKDVLAVIIDLADNPEMKVLFRYERKMGDRRVVVDDYGSIIRLLNVTEYKDNVEIIKEKGQKLVIAMHPIFIDQIAGKWVSFPGDIAARMNYALGSGRGSKATYRLRNLLARSHSVKDFSPSFTESKLLYCLAENEMSASRKTRVIEMFNSAVNTCKKINLLKNVSVTTAKVSGEPLYTFELFPVWE